MFLKTIRKYRFFILVAILFLLLRLPTLFEPNWYGDEGIYLVLGQAIRKGLLLYREIHDNKPPTLYYLAALSQTVFGFRLLLLVWMIPTLIVFNNLAKKLISSPLYKLSTLFFLLLTSIPLFEGTIANAEVFMLLPTVTAFLVIANSTNFISLVTSGLLLGFAFTIKIPVFVEFCFLALWIALASSNFDLKKIKIFKIIGQLFIFAISFALPILLFSLYFWLKGAFPEFIFAALLQNFGYLSSWATGSHSGSATSGGLVTRGIILAVFWLFLLFFTFKKSLPKNILFVSFWLSAAIFGALLSTRPYPHYLIQLLPPFCLLLILLFDKANQVLVRPLILILLFFTGFIFVNYKFYVYPVFSYYRNFYTHIFSLNSDAYLKYFSPNVPNNNQVASFVAANTTSDDRIFVWGDEPYIYAQSNRLPVGKFTVAYHVIDFNQYNSVADQLKVYYPKIIVYYAMNGRPYPQLDSFISHYYLPVKSIGNAIIYQRLN